MNKERRRRLEKIEAELERIEEELQMICHEEEEALENTPIELQETQRGQGMDASKEKLESAVGEIQTARQSITDAQ